MGEKVSFGTSEVRQRRWLLLYLLWSLVKIQPNIFIAVTHLFTMPPRPALCFVHRHFGGERGKIRCIWKRTERVISGPSAHTKHRAPGAGSGGWWHGPCAGAGYWSEGLVVLMVRTGSHCSWTQPDAALAAPDLCSNGSSSRHPSGDHLASFSLEWLFYCF